MKLRIVENWGRTLATRVSAWLAAGSAALTAMMVNSPHEWAAIMDDMPWWAKLGLVSIVWAAPASTQIVQRTD